MLFTKDEEINIANSIQALYNCRIIKSEIIPYTLYCCCDIGKIINLKKINNSCKFFDETEKKIISYFTEGGNQNLLFLTIHGLLKIINKSRKQESINFYKLINLHIYKYKFPCIESESINLIMKAFEGEIMIQQYPVYIYRVDLYFPIYRLVIECDEQHHLNHQIDDIVRQNEIIKLLDCKFIRYFPFDKNFNIMEIINKIFKVIKSNLIK